MRLGASYEVTATPAVRDGELQATAIEEPSVNAPSIPAVPREGPGRTLLGRPLHLPVALRALQHRNFRLFWSGYMVGLVGQWMQVVARGWLVLELTNSALWLGLVGFANSVPVLLFSLWGGALADTIPKRVLIIWTQIVMMAMAFALAFLTLAGVVEAWHVVVISLVAGTASAFESPARQAFTVEMVGKQDVVNAVALNSSIFNGARVVGPAIGGIVLGWQGPGMAFLLNGFAYLAVLASLFRIKTEGEARRKDGASALQRIKAGLVYVRHDPVIGPLLLLIAANSIFAFPYTVLMPVFADSILQVGQEGYGTLMAFTGIGALAGAVSLAIQSGKRDINRGRTLLIGGLGLPVFLGVFALSESYAVSLAMLIGVGWTMISINATTNTIIQTTVPDELRGRVSAVYVFLFMGMAPLGSLQAGFVADHWGAPMALLLGVSACMAVAIAIFAMQRQVTRVR